MMNGILAKARYKASKGSSCALCKPNKHGWEDKKTHRDVRLAIKHEQELRERNENV